MPFDGRAGLPGETVAVVDDGDRAGARPMGFRYLRFAKRWRWLILGALGVALLAGLVVTLLMTPQYTASSTLEIRRESFRVVAAQGVEPEAQPFDMEFYQTQYGLLRANSLAERVARELRLFDDPAFFEMFGAKQIAERLRAGGAQIAAPAAREARIRSAGSILLGHVAITPTRASRLVEVSFTSPSADLSARVANAWSRLFIETTLERKFEATSYARRFLEQRLDQLRQRLEESERLVVNYASRQGIINIPTPTGPDGRSGERPLVAENLSELNTALNEAIAARVAAQSRLRGSGGSTTEALGNQAISSLRARRAELAAEYARMLTQFEPEYPPARAMQSQIQQLDRSIAREEGRVRSTLQDAFEAASAREAALQQRVQALRADLLDQRGRSIQYNIYQREVDTNRQLYDGLLQRYKEIGVAGGVGVNNVSIVDLAQVPSSPSSPRLFVNLILALMMGGVIGIGLALAFDQIDEAISDPSDVEPMLGLPLIGTIPMVSGADPRVELEDRKSSVYEAYLSAQTRIGFTTDHGIPRSMAITSSRPGEGKSTSSYALARSLSRTGKKVILIDADMRSPSMHHFFGISNEMGLSNYLAGATDLAKLLKHDEPSGLSLLSAGPPPPNAAELLTGDRMTRLLDELLQHFDHVVLDLPPVMGLADAPLIASQAEGVIFVVQSHATGATAAKVAVNRLRDARARVFGVLLTKFETKRAHYGYGYEYGYGYGDRDKAEA